MTTVNIGELCRLCVNPSYYHTNVFQTHSLDGKRLYETLNATCQLNIVEGDSLPNYICMPCACKMSEIEVFKQNSQKGREKLLSFLKNKECGITDTDGRTRCSGGEEIEIEEHQAVLKIEQVEELNEGGVLEECGDEEDSFKVEKESPIIAIAHECDTADMGGVSRCSGSERIGLEEHHAVIKMEQVEEPNEGEFTEEHGNEEHKAEFETSNKAVAHDSSVPDYLTVWDEMNSEAAWHNQEHRVVDVQTLKGSLEMWNSERCEVPLIQKETNDKANEESAVIAKGCCDNNEDNREECRIKEKNMYKGRLRNKMRNIDENLADKYRKSDGIKCRGISTNNVCSKRLLGTKNSGDSIALTASQKATEVKSVVKKTVDKPVIISKGSNSIRNKSKRDLQRYFCDTCEKGFRDKWHLGHHVRIHNGVRLYQCSICNKSFTSKCILLSHNSVHTVIGKPHVCTECGKSFKHERSLRLHNNLHNDHTPFPCVTCGKLFKSLITFQEHLKIHAILKPFSCKICNKCFGKKSILVQHQKTHEINRNKPFSCDTCKKSFSTKQDLQKHIYSHDSFKRHKCSICAKRFSLKQNLQRHTKIHSTERAFKCPNCFKCYSRLDTVKYHMKFYCKKMHEAVSYI